MFFAFPGTQYVQAALVIHGFGYSHDQKTTANNEQK